MKRRIFIFKLLSALLLCSAVFEAREIHAADNCLVYVGTYTTGASKGVYAYRMDLASGMLSPLGLVAETPNPTFVDIDPSGRFFYAANEVNEWEGKAAGAVTSYAIDAATGKLTQLNQRSSMGPGPCHILIDGSGKNALVANYAGGSIALLPIGADGSLAEASFFQQYEGKGPNAKRQEKAHAHCMALDAANKFAFACDLGTDKIMVYHFDPAHGTLSPNNPPFVSVKPGVGPRHITFAPNGHFAYVINELASSVTVFSYDARLGRLGELQTISTLPEGFKAQNTCAEITVHPSGKFLYGSNRGHNSIAVFAIDPALGTLTFVERTDTGGKIPRHFALDPTGKFLIAANQDSNNLVVFAVDAATGKLKPTGQALDLPAPVCVRFLPR